MIMENFLIVGHRGAAQLPENTIPSFEKALELGAHGFELDGRQTSDQKLVVVHGAVVGSLSVQANTYHQLNATTEGQEIPLLEEVLKKFPHLEFLDIELKSPGFEKEVVELIQMYCDPTRVLVSAFDPDVLTKMYNLSSQIELGFIYNRTQDEESRHNCPVDVLKPQFRLTSRELIEEVHDEGLRVIPWTVNDEKEMRRLINLGVDGIISDYPKKLLEIVQES